MKAKIISVEKNLNDFQFPQVDVVVEYRDKGFPEGKRQHVFTLPAEKFSALDVDELKKLIVDTGKMHQKTINDNKEAVSKEDLFKEIIGEEITI